MPKGDIVGEIDGYTDMKVLWLSLMEFRFKMMKINGGKKFRGSEMQGRIKFLHLRSPLKSVTLKG